MNKKEKILLSVILIALTISLGFNYLLYNEKFNNSNARSFSLILEIYKKEGDYWKLLFRKTNDLLKYNFGNLTKLFFANLHNFNNETISIYYLHNFYYASYQDLINDNMAFYQSCGLLKTNINTNIDNQGKQLIFVFLPNQHIGIWKKTFDIGFGNDTSIFTYGENTFPQLRHNIDTIVFGNFGSKCAEASHLYIDYNLGIETATITNSTTNQIYIKYIGYWQNPYPSFNIKYTRLYIPLVWKFDNEDGYRRYISLIAEDLVNSGNGVLVYLNDLVKFVYILVIN
jgi:hypothetical protein